MATSKPREVRLGVLLLWIALAIGTIDTSLHAFRFDTRLSFWLLIASLALAALISAFFIGKISRGRNWARVTYLIWMLLGTAVTLSRLPALFHVDPVLAIGAGVRVALVIYGACLLFTTTSDLWFVASKRNAAEENGVRENS